MAGCSFCEGEFEKSQGHGCAGEPPFRPGIGVPVNSVPPVCVESRLSGLIYAESHIKGVSWTVRLNFAAPAPRPVPLPKENVMTAETPPAEFYPCIEIVKAMNWIMAEFFNLGNLRPGEKKDA